MSSDETILKKRLFVEAYRRERTVAGALRYVQQKHNKVILRATVSRWMETDEKFRQRLSEIEDEIVDELVEKLMDLARQGDRQAIMTLLKRYRPDEFGDDDRGPSIQVISEIPRPVQWARTRVVEGAGRAEGEVERQEDTASVQAAAEAGDLPHLPGL